ncbi:MAG: RecX family transcriptional regulator [Gammaproteobacteria bacterium]|nr:RecX family transcriptional regulator [Gammaproteobacteria bacterium]
MLKSLIKDQDIRKKILDLLSRREHSKYELVLKLERRVDSSDKLLKEIDKISDQNLQSDERFSESYIRSRYNSGFGPSRIKYDLVKRRVAESIINDAFRDIDLNWLEKLKKENIKKYGNENPKNMQELSKRTKFFVQRGFDQEMIRKIIYL